MIIKRPGNSVFKKYIEKNENEKVTYENKWDSGKEVLRGKFAALTAYITEEEWS